MYIDAKGKESVELKGKPVRARGGEEGSVRFQGGGEGGGGGEGRHNTHK